MEDAAFYFYCMRTLLPSALGRLFRECSEQLWKTEKEQKNMVQFGLARLSSAYLGTFTSSRTALLSHSSHISPLIQTRYHPCAYPCTRPIQSNPLSFYHRQFHSEYPTIRNSHSAICSIHEFALSLKNDPIHHCTTSHIASLSDFVPSHSTSSMRMRRSS